MGSSGGAIGPMFFDARQRYSDYAAVGPDGEAVPLVELGLHRRYNGNRPVGTGLGLAIVRELAQAMGGDARVRTSPTGMAAFIPRASSTSPRSWRANGA